MKTTAPAALILLFLLFSATGCGDEPASERAEGDAATPGTEPLHGAPAEPPRELDPERESRMRGLIGEDPANATAHQQLARDLIQTGRADEAVVHFEKAVELDPYDPRTMLDLALAYSIVGRDQEAVDVYTRLLDYPEQRPIALHNMGNMALKENRSEEAVELFNQAIVVKPDYMRAHYRLGIALEQMEQLREAYRSYGKALELEPPDDPAGQRDYVDALYRMGKLDLTMGATARAAEIFESVLEVHPDHPKAHYDYGRALMMLGRQEDAQKEFDQHMKLLARSGQPPSTSSEDGGTP